MLLGKAITLIALVITIIVLLILAGVTINLVLGPEGLLKQAQDATDRYKEAENEELNSMLNILAQLEGINNGNGGDTGTPTEPEKPQKPSIPAGEITKTENNINYVSDGEGNEIAVPIGFSYAGVGTKETGFVIKNDVDLNEFVWIPTDLVEYKIYDWNKGKSATDYTEYYTSDATENETIINEITKSVSDHKGYYISRYEAGVTTKRTSSTENQADLPLPIFRATSSTTPIYAYDYLTWDDAIYLGNKLYNKEKGDNVTSRLINARGWDTALKFIETVGEDKDSIYPTNPIGKGWYSDNKSNNSNREIGKSIDLTNATIPNKLKNIYDMGGNVREWTASIDTSDSTKRTLRRRRQ